MSNDQSAKVRWFVVEPWVAYLDDLVNMGDRRWSVAADSFGDKLHTIVNGAEEVNARLIAAAPDMLEALKSVQKWLANNGHSPLCLDEIESAIAKATGAK
jgi:hypothetical protein